MNSWIIVMAGLVTALTQDVTQHPICLNRYYWTKDGNTSIVACYGVPIENVSIPTEANLSERLVLELINYTTQTMDWIPTGLFPKNNLIRKLDIYAPASDESHSIGRLKSDTFVNLQGLVELSMRGFERIRHIDRDLFRPLVSLKKIRLNGFGGQFLTYSQLGDALLGFSNSSLEEITMDSIHAKANKEKALDLNNLFRISGVNITSLVLTSNDFNSVTGKLSSVLPSLKYFECSMYWLTYAVAMSFSLDSLIFLEHIEEVNFSYSSRSKWRKRRSLNRRRRDNILDVFGPDKTMSDYFLSLNKSNKCYFDVWLKFSPTLKRFVVKNINFFDVKPNVEVCFDENTEIEYFDFSKSPMGEIPGTMRGLRKLRFFNLQETSMNFISYSLFHEMPSLEILLLGRNNIGESVAADVEGSLFKFQNHSLRSLDLSGCGISRIPQLMFSELSALQLLNLSSNMIETFQVKLHPSGNLSLLNLSDNSIRIFSREMIFELESLQSSDDNRTKLTIDLSRNPLSCLCNETDFVVWLKSTKKVSFENSEEYTCLHPSGSKVSVNTLSITELQNNCKSLKQLQTTCPCGGLDYKLLRQMMLSLTDVYCTYEGKRLSYADLVANSNKTLQEYWWCSRENPFYMSPKFIVPVIIGFLVLVLLAIALFVVYKKRYTPSDVARMMQCMDLRPYIMHFIKYLSNHPAYTSENYEFDVFVYFQDDDGHWVRRVLLEKLKHLKVITLDNFLIGASMADAILDGCKKSRVVILVLSKSFKGDDWCREVTLRSYTSHPGSVIPVVINNTDLTDFDDDLLFANLIATHSPMDLSSANLSIWNEFVSRVEHTN